MGGSTIPGEYILPGLIGRFRDEYPHLTVKLQITDSRKAHLRNSVGLARQRAYKITPQEYFKNFTDKFFHGLLKAIL